VAYLPRSTGGRGKIQQRPDPRPVQSLPLNQTGISPHLEFSYLHHGLLDLICESEPIAENAESLNHYSQLERLAGYDRVARVGFAAGLCFVSGDCLR
jgi:hypothetical protein